MVSIRKAEDANWRVDDALELALCGGDLALDLSPGLGGFQVLAHVVGSVDVVGCLPVQRSAGLGVEDVADAVEVGLSVGP